MAYQLRSKTGILKAKLSNYLAGVIINGVKGEFVQKRLFDSVKTVYEIEVDAKIGGVNETGVVVFLWEEDYLYKDE